MASRCSHFPLAYFGHRAFLFRPLRLASLCCLSRHQKIRSSFLVRATSASTRFHLAGISGAILLRGSSRPLRLHFRRHARPHPRGQQTASRRRVACRRDPSLFGQAAIRGDRGRLFRGVAGIERQGDAAPRRARLLRYNGAYSQGLEAIIRWKLSAPKFSKICAAAAPRANEKLPFAPAGRILLPRNARKFSPFLPATPTKSSPPARRMRFSRSL